MFWTEEWINFISSTTSSLANMDYLWYGSPNVEAMEQYPDFYFEKYGEELDEETLDIIITPDDVLQRCQMYTNLPQDTLSVYNDLWTKLGV